MTDAVSERLRSAGFELPATPDALGSYVPAVMIGGLVFTSGQLPMHDGALLSSGRVGAEVSLQTARTAAEQAVLNALAAASTVCDLDRVVRVVRMSGFVASAQGFTAQPSVIDAASQVLSAAYPGSGGHARLAVGVAALPLDAPVEIELVLAVEQAE
jgi:enamine deaminase RidA (YjgF/YER057c/UK114 family)